MADKQVDARGLNCPLPILRAKQALDEMDSGQTVHVLATDPSSVLDFKASAARTGHQLLEAQQVNDEFSFLLQKA